MVTSGDVHAAAERGDWTLVLSETTPVESISDDALEVRASALYATGDLEGSIEVWERLHARAVAAERPAEGARCAVMVALSLLIDTGLMAPVRAWLARAEALMEHEPTGPVHALISVVSGYERLFTGDVAEARVHAERAVELADQHDVVMAAVIGRVAQVRLLALDGHIDEGVRALGEAGALLMSGVADPVTTGMMLCEIVCAAQNLAMPDLAREWTDTMERWGHTAAIGSVRGRCRVHSAELLRMSGPGEQAETVALEACAALQPWLRREYGWPLTELGTIRLRTGDLVGAEEAFLAADALAWSPQPGLARLRLAQGDPQSAAVLIGETIDHPPELPWKERPPTGELCIAPLLEAQVEIAAASSDAATCAAAADRLERIAQAYPTRGLAASAVLAGARAALVGGDPDSCVRLALDAARRWADLGAPYETAEARVIAGDASAAAGRNETARNEWAAASRGFASYGASMRMAEVEQRLAGRRPPAVRTTSAAVFRRDGAVRIVGFGGMERTVPDLLGYRYLEHLLTHPGEQIAALDLVGAERGGSGRVQYGLPALDEQAREAYRRRLAEVEDEMAEASAMNDLSRLAQVQRDHDFLVAELSRAVGLGGRIRTVADDAERARTSVFRTIRYATDHLAALDPELGEHLRHSIRTGTWCSYTPDPLAQVCWER